MRLRDIPLGEATCLLLNILRLVGMMAAENAWEIEASGGSREKVRFFMAIRSKRVLFPTLSLPVTTIWGNGKCEVDVLQSRVRSHGVQSFNEQACRISELLMQLRRSSGYGIRQPILVTLGQYNTDGVARVEYPNAVDLRARFFFCLIWLGPIHINFGLASFSSYIAPL